MKLVVPFTKVVPEVKESVEQYGAAVRWVDVSSDDEAYWRLLSRLWDEQETVVINEHDIVGEPGIHLKLDSCPYAWCVVPYRVAGRTMACLGLTKFHRVLLRDMPRVLDPKDRHWAHQDVVIAQNLLAARVIPHLHMPLAVHLNPKKDQAVDDHIPGEAMRRFVEAMEVTAGDPEPANFSMSREDLVKLWEGSKKV